MLREHREMASSEVSVKGNSGHNDYSEGKKGHSTFSGTSKGKIPAKKLEISA